MDEVQQIYDNLAQELHRGTLVISVLLVLKKEEYGYSIVKNLQKKKIDIEQNTLYPLLRRLEKQRLLQSNWDVSETRPRKYYKISTIGEKVLKKLLEKWQGLNNAIDTIIKEVK